MPVPLPPSIQLPGAYPLPPSMPLAQPTLLAPRVDASMPGVVDSKPNIPDSNVAPPSAVPDPATESLDQVEALQQREREVQQEQERQEEERQREQKEREQSEAVESAIGESSGKPQPEAATLIPDTVDLPPVDLVPEIAEVQTVEVFGFDIPMPRTEILVTATSTAAISSVAAVAGTLFATTLFRQLQPILKPIFKTLLKKLAKVRKKPPPKTWARLRLENKSVRIKEQTGQK